MKLIIAGSRNYENFSEALDWFNFHCETKGMPTEIVSGCAKGADKLGEMIAMHYGLKLKRFPAKWNIHGKAAGPIRNAEMAKYADEALIFWDGKSRGSKDMISKMRSKGKRVKVFTFKEEK